MEHNKVLMVIVSVAIFFAAVIGVGVALLYPRGDDANLASSDGIVQQFDPIEYVRRPSDSELAPQDQSERPVVIVYGDPETPDQPSDTTTQPVVGTDDDPDSPDDSRITITERPARTSTRGTEEPASSTSPAPSDATEPASTDAEPTAPSPAPATASPTQPPSPREIRVTEYWIQLIASPNRDRVEQARGSLADYSLGGRVTTRDINGELYYRLRVGPYTSASEAEKFLEWIRDIEGFEGAYVSEEYPLRTVSS
jgi:cell division septation protein DedD